MTFEHFRLKKEFVELCRHNTKAKIIDVALLTFLVENHPRFHEKISGFVGFGFNERGDGFVALFQNPSRSEPFSFKACIDGIFANRGQGSRRGDPLARDVRNAFRTEISDQTESVRVLSGKVGQGKEWHVGHDNENGNSFQAILKDFLASRNIVCVDNIAIDWRFTKWSSEFKSPFLVNAALSASWREFHASRARGMRMETARENLTTRRK